MDSAGRKNSVSGFFLQGSQRSQANPEAKGAQIPEARFTLNWPRVEVKSGKHQSWASQPAVTQVEDNADDFCCMDSPKPKKTLRHGLKQPKYINYKVDDRQ